MPEPDKRQAPSSGSTPSSHGLAPDEVEHVQRCFESFVDVQSVPPGRRSEVSRQLQLLYAQLRAGKVRRATAHALLQLAEAVDARDEASAAKARTAISSSADWEGCRCWLPAVRWLLVTAAAPAAPSAPRALVGPPVMRSTAPEATGPPPVEGLPESWPQKARARAPAAKGRALAAAEAARVRRALGSLLTASGGAGGTRCAEAGARIEELCAKLEAGEVKAATCQTLLRLVRKVEMGELAAAGQVLSEIAAADWAASRRWLPAVRGLLHTSG